MTSCISVPGLLTFFFFALPFFTDVIGSPYAIAEYHCNSQLGTDEDIRTLRKKLNSFGLYLMLDYVPNVRIIDFISKIDVAS